MLVLMVKTLRRKMSRKVYSTSKRHHRVGVRVDVECDLLGAVTLLNELCNNCCLYSRICEDMSLGTEQSLHGTLRIRTVGDHQI